jgi:hypothetical protein
MPVDIHFNTDENLIVATWTNPVTHNDFAEAFKLAKTAYEKATAPIHTIYDAGTLIQLPANSISIYLRDPHSPLKHKMAGLFIVVAGNAFIRAIVTTAGKAARNPRVHVTATVEEAHEIVARTSRKAS